MSQYNTLCNLHKILINKKVVNIQGVGHEGGVTVRLTFENGYHLNFTYNDNFESVGIAITRALIDHDLGEILTGKVKDAMESL